MKFLSTNLKAESVSFREALLKGLAPDGGLYFPTEIPRFPEGSLEKWRSSSYAEIATDILEIFLDGDVPSEILAALCEDAYQFPVPLEQVEGHHYIMRLDQGPTASFKDFAARMMARLMSHFLKEDKRDLLILTATSGDTGGAIADAFYGVEGVQVVVLFPKDEVSERQRRQMTTLGGNIRSVAIEGKFDDCQNYVKKAFQDQRLSHLPLSSANSINIGRLLPQMVYYIYAYSQLAKSGQKFDVVVPCGNFGNVMGAMLAREMGLPIERYVVAVNENDEFPSFLESGSYQKIEPSKNCVSNAMNVGHPSNLARLVHLFGGQMDSQGTIHKMPDLKKIKEQIFATSVSDAETRQTIQDVYCKHKVLLEPHGAVAWTGAERYWKECKGSKQELQVVVETAHPAKFPEEIEKLLQFSPEVPDSLKSLEQKEESYQTLDADYEDFVSYLLS